MATSPIYSWPEPDNTDLVKNGALAIRTLGNAIDTTMGTMVPKTIVDAKGDLIAGTAADTAARLAVGNNGETLVADSSTTTGLNYSAGSTRGNPVINSGMDIWQRGTTVAAAGSQFGPDRWNSFRGAFAAGITVSRQATSDTTNLPFIQYCARVQRDAGNTSTNGLNFSYNFENVDTTEYIGKTVTLSFYARKGANYSSTSSLLSVELNTGTGIDQTARGGFTGPVLVVNQGVTLTTTWQRFSYTGTIPTTALQMYINFVGGATGTAGAADYFEITGVQIDLSSTALPYRRYSATIQGETSACQRYYWRQDNSSLLYKIFGMGSAKSTTQAIVSIPFPTSMRVPPSTLDWGGAIILNDGSGGQAATTIVNGNFDTTSMVASALVTVASGLTQFRPYFLTSNASGGTYLGFSAEL